MRRLVSAVFLLTAGAILADTVPVTAQPLFGRLNRDIVYAMRNAEVGELCPRRRAADNSSVGKWHFVW